MRVSSHLSPTSPFAGFSRTSMFLIPLIISEAFSMLVIAAQVAALDPLMVTCASTIMVFLLGLEWWPIAHGQHDASISVLTRVCRPNDTVHLPRRLLDREVAGFRKLDGRALLDQVVRQGTRQMLQKAVEAEMQVFSRNTQHLLAPGFSRSRNPCRRPLRPRQ